MVAPSPFSLATFTRTRGTSGKRSRTITDGASPSTVCSMSAAMRLTSAGVSATRSSAPTAMMHGTPICLASLAAPVGVLVGACRVTRAP